MAYRLLPVSDLPVVDFPTIQVSGNLPGASPETVASAVALPLEKQFSTIAGLRSMSSSNTPRAFPKCGLPSESKLPSGGCKRAIRDKRPRLLNIPRIFPYRKIRQTLRDFGECPFGRPPVFVRRLETPCEPPYGAEGGRSSL